MQPGSRLISPLSRLVEENGARVEVAVFRLEPTGWNLEIVASNGWMTVWEVAFESDEAAFVEAMSAIRDEGIESFFERRWKRGGLP